MSQILDHAEPASLDITSTKMTKVAKHFFMVDVMETGTISLLKGIALQLVEIIQPLLKIDQMVLISILKL